MGYCIELQDWKFYIKNEDKAKALEVLKEKAKMSKRVYSSTYDYIKDTSTLEDAMTKWGYEPDIDEKGNIRGLVCFNGDKLGDEDVMFDAIAPYVKKGSYIEMTGEEGGHWRWAFDGKNMKEKQAKVTW